MRETISVSLPSEVREELDQAAESDGRSRSEVVREALRDYLFQRRYRRLRGRMVERAREKGVFTDEDVFGPIS
jgi:metal-responsive CopG/Arc/MetJ family transcriptional regulator